MQVERIADVAVLKPQDVKIPGVLVDCVVVSTPEHHSQTWGTAILAGDERRAASTAVVGSHRSSCRFAR